MANGSFVPLRNCGFNIRNIWTDAVVVPAEAANVCQPRYNLVDVVSGPELAAGRLLDYE